MDLNYIFYSQKDSTNKYLKENYQEHNNLDVVYTYEQTDGRGRNQRKFLSKKGGAYFSILLKPPFECNVLHLTSIMAVASKRGIKKALNKEVSIKWVNDLIYNNKKVGGILTEAVTIDNEIKAIVIGVGVNVNRPEGGFEEFEDIATSLVDRLGSIEEVVHKIVTSFIDIYLGHEDIYEEYKESLNTLNQKVLVSKNNREAKAIDLDEDFNLIVEYSDKTVDKIFTGEITIIH